MTTLELLTIPGMEGSKRLREMREKGERQSRAAMERRRLALSILSMQESKRQLRKS